MFNIGPMELAVVLIVALLVVGPKRLPEIGRTLGKSLREFRKVQDDLRSSIDLGLDDDDAPARPSFDAPPKRTPGPSSARHRHHEDDEDDEDDEQDDHSVAEASDEEAPLEGPSPDDPSTDGETPAR